MIEKESDRKSNDANGVRVCQRRFREIKERFSTGHRSVEKKKPHVSIEISTIETGGAFSRDCPTSGGNKKHASKLRNPFANIKSILAILFHAVGSNDDAAERFDMLLGRVRHLGGGARARGATAAGRVTHLQNTEPGMPAFQRLMSVYSAEAMVASGVFPGRDPMNPMRTAVLCIVVQETRRQRGRDAKGNELSTGARARRARRGARGSRGDAARSRAISRKHRARARPRAAIDARAARVRRPRAELQTPASHPRGRISRVFDKRRAAETRAGGSRERARGAARAQARGQVAPRATADFGGRESAFGRARTW